MQNKILKGLLLATLSISTNVLAFGNHDTWVSGFAQGVSEYIVLGQGQAKLYLACDGSDSRAEMLIFTDPSGRQINTDSGKRITVQIDREEPVDVSETNSRVGSDNFAWMWDKLRSGNHVTLSGEGVKSATFTLKGANKVLPAYDKSDCVPKLSL